MADRKLTARERALDELALVYGRERALDELALVYGKDELAGIVSQAIQAAREERDAEWSKLVGDAVLTAPGMVAVNRRLDPEGAHTVIVQAWRLARSHTRDEALREPSEEEVERSAAAAYEAFVQFNPSNGPRRRWTDETDENIRDAWRGHARAGLTDFLERRRHG